jgi:type III secretion protein O
MQYALKDLFRAREFRKDKATDNVLKAKELLAKAERELDEKIKILNDFIEKKPKEVKKIYDKVMLKNVKRGAVDDIHFELAALDIKQEELQNIVNIAKQKVKDAEDNVQNAKDLLRKAEKDLEKIQEHKSLWVEEVKKLEEEVVEKEMEDFRVKPPESFD